MSHKGGAKWKKGTRSMRQDEGAATVSTPIWASKRPPENARCSRCGSTEISCLPSFSVGSGIAVRPVAEDVYCRRCGHIGSPVL